jgi:hypothetical protein
MPASRTRLILVASASTIAAVVLALVVGGESGSGETERLGALYLDPPAVKAGEKTRVTVALESRSRASLVTGPGNQFERREAARWQEVSREFGSGITHPIAITLQPGERRQIDSFETTKMLEKAIAAAATIGFSSPATASGIAATL